MNILWGSDNPIVFYIGNQKIRADFGLIFAYFAIVAPPGEQGWYFTFLPSSLAD